MIAFLVFTSNITGHAASLAKNMVEQNFEEILSFFIWLILFFAGAFMSNYIIRSVIHKNYYRAHAIPIIIEIVILLVVAIYGHNFYAETQTEREIVIGLTIFAMGVQNGLVSTVSGGLIKSTHLTGLFTDLGAEVAEYIHPKTGKDKLIRNKIFVRLTVLAFYLVGGLVGGFFFDRYEFAVFYFVPVILLVVLL
ncbi:MAG: DUF1275 domain-containing protein [Sphingobacteriales bacterium]|nr:MAG: DUF1275 domain-containing protein [Sphingobacteriales bacterium]